MLIFKGGYAFEYQDPICVASVRLFFPHGLMKTTCFLLVHVDSFESMLIQDKFNLLFVEESSPILSSFDRIQLEK